MSILVSVRSRLAQRIGTASQATRNEMIRLAAIVNDSALKNAPVTPLRKASGVKIMMVAAEEQRRITRLRLAKLLEAEQDTNT